MEEALKGKLNHNFIGLITMERLIESILSITIMDEKDIDHHYHNESCATSMHSHMSGHLNMKQVSDEIDHSMDLSMKDISPQERQNIWKPRFFKMYIDGLRKGVQKDIKLIRNGHHKKDDEEFGTPAFLKDKDIEEEPTNGDNPAFGAQLRKNKKQKSNQMS